MQLTKAVWTRMLDLNREVSRRGEVLSRAKISDALHISEYDARFLKDAFKYRHIISFKPDQLNTTSGQKVLVLSDLHMPFHDKAALETALAYGDTYQPDTIVLLGDTIDFYKISRWVKNPVKKTVVNEMKEVRSFLTDLRLRFPEAHIIYYKGNHEDRLDTYLMSQAGELYELLEDLLENKLTLHELKIEYKTEPFRIGKLWYMHGHEKPGGSYNPEYVTNVMFRYVLDNFIVGHFHRNQTKFYKRIDHTSYKGMAVGYLAGEMDYALINAWNHGFATIDYASDGNFKGNVYAIMDGEIH